MKTLRNTLRSRSRREKLLITAVAALSGLLVIIMTSNYLQQYAHQASARLAESERQLTDVRAARAERNGLALLDLTDLRDTLPPGYLLAPEAEQDGKVLKARFPSWQALVTTLAKIESDKGIVDLRLTVTQHDGNVILTAEKEEE